MAFTKITDADLQNKGVIGLPDTPGLSTTEMQEKFDEIALDVLAPKHNGLVDELNNSTAAGNMGALSAQGTASTVQAELDNRYPISTVTQLLNNKVDKEPGKSLSTNDFSAAYKYKLDYIEDYANNYVLPKGSQISLGGVMGDGTTFTIDEDGYGHAIGGGGGGTADYNALVNKPVVNGVTVSGSKDSEAYGIIRPKIYVTSEAGSTITISKGGETITATQVTGSTTVWEVHPTDYGTWTVSSDLPGADVASTTIVIDAVKEYAITVEHITATITVTYQAGATCVCKKGTTEYVATSNPQTFTVRSIGNWTIETVYDGITKSVTVPITADGQTESVTLEYATIEVTYGNAFRGTTITCASGATVYSKTAPSGGNTLSFTIASTGSWVVSGTVSGDTYSQTVVVSTMTTYPVTLNVFNATVTVTFPYSDGASCTITDGVTTLTANTSPMAFNVPNVGTWTATCTLDGVSAPTQSAVITTDGQTETMTFAFGTINLTYDNAFRGLTITCVNGGTTISKTAPISGNTMAFYPPSTGEWIISSTYSGTPYQVTATITSLAIAVSAQLQMIPDGDTVTPTDDIQKWLNCAGIFDKVTYTTLADVLADSTTLLALMSSNNACDYLVRSNSFATAVGLVPTMTSNTTPSGVASASSVYSSPTYDAYHAFDNGSFGWHPQKSGSQQWVQYEFPSACVVRKLTFKNVSGSVSHQGNIKLKGSNDGSTFVDIDTFIDGGWSGASYTSPVAFTFTNNTAYKYYRVEFNNTGEWNMDSGVKFQFYMTAENEGLCDNSTAMTDIGANDYCAETLLADSTWCNAICNSAYFESVLTTKVPTMTSNTTPSGECIGNAASASQTNYQFYHAFCGDNTKFWAYNDAQDGWVGYDFGEPITCFRFRFNPLTSNQSATITYKVQGTNDINGAWYDVTSLQTIQTSSAVQYSGENSINAENILNFNTPYRYFRYKQETSSYGHYTNAGAVQFYGR